MESIKISILEKVIAWFTGGGAYSTIKSVVDSFMNEDMTGEEKKEAVKKIIMPLLGALSGVLINLAIEVAVLALRSAAGDKNVTKKA